MAIITFDHDNDSISILVEKTDIITDRESNTTSIKSAKDYVVGKVFINEEVNLCMIRGERT